MATAARRPATVAGYLAALPADRRKVVEAIRRLVRAHIPDGYHEDMWWGCIGWSVPLERFPNTYNGQPLGYVAVAAQKNYYTLHLMSLYGGSQRLPAFQAAFAKAGLRLDMGKACVRFRSLDDLPLDVIAREVASFPVDEWIARSEAARAAATGSRPAKSATKRATKAAPRASAAKKRATARR